VLHPLSDNLSDNARVSRRGVHGEGRPVSFATDTREKTGEDDRRTREHLARAEALGPDIHAPHASPMQAPCKPHASPMQAPCKPHASPMQALTGAVHHANVFGGFGGQVGVCSRPSCLVPRLWGIKNSVFLGWVAS
jgi:hypothetical protein